MATLANRRQAQRVAAQRQADSRKLGMLNSGQRKAIRDAQLAADLAVENAPDFVSRAQAEAVRSRLL